MEKQKFITEKPETILDLGTGYSNVHLNAVETVEATIDMDGKSKDQTIWMADVIRVANPPHRDAIISAIIRDRFTDDFREAALRKGILDQKDSDYVSFNSYAEDAKKMVADAGVIE